MTNLNLKNEVLLESIVNFQCIESFNDATGLDYDELNDDELIEVLSQWHYPGEHDTNWYSSDNVNTNFLGYQFRPGCRYLLSRYENGFVIGLSYITETR